MPATSELADRLANDLVTIGKILGLESVKEAPVLEGSTYRVDVLWTLAGQFNVASIEIQCSDSPTSISHNIFKSESTLHPSKHIVISYNKLTENYKEILNRYPGIVIKEGKKEIERLKSQISRIINEPNEVNRDMLCKRFLSRLTNQKKTDPEKEKLMFELWFERLFEPVVYEITVFSHFFEGNGELGYTFFATGTLEEAKAQALKLNKEKGADAPFDWDGKSLSLKNLEITCYQLLQGPITRQEKEHNNIVYGVAMNGKLGSEENYFTFSRKIFCRNPKEAEKIFSKDLKNWFEPNKLFRTILEQNKYVAKYLKIQTWKEPIKGEVLLITNVIPSGEEQKKMLKTYFIKEFGLGVEDFISLNDIRPTGRYSENFVYIKEQLCEQFNRYSEDFKSRMSEDDFIRFQEWLDILW